MPDLIVALTVAPVTLPNSADEFDGFDAELGDGVNIRLVSDAVVNRLINRNAIEQESIALLAVAVDVWTTLRALPDAVETTGIRVDRARHKQSELLEVAAVERQAWWSWCR